MNLHLGAPVNIDDDQADQIWRNKRLTRNIEWKDQTQVIEALVTGMHPEAHYFYLSALQPGQGLICNNVPHNRSTFESRSKSVAFVILITLL